MGLAELGVLGFLVGLALTLAATLALATVALGAAALGAAALGAALGARALRILRGRAVGRSR